MTEDSTITTILTDRQTDRQLLVLELFAGTRSISKAFERRGHKTFCIDWDTKFEGIDLYKDVRELTADEILQKFGQPDVIWASPDCTSYSLAAISRHRKKNPITGNLDPISEYAKFCDDVNQHVLKLIRELNPKLYFIENPRGGLCSMSWMQGIPKYLTTYCQYVYPYMKPTHIFTNHPNPQFKHCKNGDPCHERAPRGTKQGLQKIKSVADRATIPPLLCDHIVDISEQYILRENLTTNQELTNRNTN